MLKLGIAVVMLLAASLSYAQRGVTPGFVAPASVSPAFTGNAGLVLQRPMHLPQHSHDGRFPASAFIGSPWFADYALPAYAAQPTVVVLQPVPAPDAKPEERKPGQPLLIEWQGDRFVRISNDGAARQKTAPANFVADSPMRRQSNMSNSAEIPPVLLIYRDGHQEDVRSYTITGGILYADGDYWQSGHWTRQIQLAALDVPATIRTNQEHGVSFRVPSAPNEVIARP